VTAMQVECLAQNENMKQDISEGRDVGRQTMFTTLLSEQDKPKSFRIPSTWELKDEACSVLVAVADTTGDAVTVAAFNVLHNSQIQVTRNSPPSYELASLIQTARYRPLSSRSCRTW